MNIMMSKADFAADRGVDVRTVTRWIAAERLPDAKKLPSGEWQIPSSATLLMPTKKPASATATSETSVAVAGHVPDMSRLSLLPAPERTRDEQLADAPTWLTVTEAARLLDIPRAAILEDPDEYGAKKNGPRLADGTRALRVPLKTIRAARG